jgi:nicotinamide riboside transporter PnuC
MNALTYLVAAAAYVQSHPVEVLAALCGVIGTVALALNGPRAGWGFVWYLGSNAGWITFAAITRQWPLLVQNIVFTASSILGVWVWLVLKQPQRELEDMRRRKDSAYEERNKVVAALAQLFPSGVARTAIEGWSQEWHGCVYIDLPTGQVSWHFHDSQAHLFEGLPAYTKDWDGHDTPEKYRRLAALADGPGQHCGVQFLPTPGWSNGND